MACLRGLWIKSEISRVTLRSPERGTAHAPRRSGAPGSARCAHHVLRPRSRSVGSWLARPVFARALCPSTRARNFQRVIRVHVRCDCAPWSACGHADRPTWPWRRPVRSRALALRPCHWARTARDTKRAGRASVARPSSRASRCSKRGLELGRKVKAYRRRCSTA